GDLTFDTTLFAASSTPVITEGPSVDSFDVSDSRAVVRWDTDEPASSFVRYGPGSPPNLALLVDSDELALEHQLLLPDLRPSTEYCYQAGSTDPDNNTVLSDTECFTTDDLPDANPPLVIDDPTTRSGGARAANEVQLQATYVNTDRVVLEWQTDEPATAELFL